MLLRKFDQPVGAKADVAELLYIYAIHQTSDEVRQDASTNADDISHFLMSRYRISISPETVSETALSHFSYGGEKNGFIRSGWYSIHTSVM